MADKPRPQVVALQPHFGGYRLERQIGFLLRKAHQRHTAIFSARMGEDLTRRTLCLNPHTDAGSMPSLGLELALDRSRV